MDTGEITKETVKTIRAGSAGSFRRTCGDYARVLFPLCTRGCGCTWASGIPCALFLLIEGQADAKLGRLARAENRRSCPGRGAALSLAVRRRAGTDKGIEKNHGPRLSIASLACCAASGAPRRLKTISESLLRRLFENLNLEFTRSRLANQLRDHLPVHTGLRFSPNAFNPSLASSVIASSAIWLSV